MSDDPDLSRAHETTCYVLSMPHPVTIFKRHKDPRGITMCPFFPFSSPRWRMRVINGGRRPAIFELPSQISFSLVNDALSVCRIIINNDLDTVGVVLSR